MATYTLVGLLLRSRSRPHVQNSRNNGRRNYKDIVKNVIYCTREVRCRQSGVFNTTMTQEHMGQAVKKRSKMKMSMQCLAVMAQSTILNSTENLWENVSRRAQHDNCSNLNSIWKQIEKAWYEAGEFYKSKMCICIEKQRFSYRILVSSKFFGRPRIFFWSGFIFWTV